jgi:hypothetical protein
MSKAGTALRLIRQRDRLGLVQVLTRSILPASLFRVNEMLIARLRTVRPLPRPLPKIRIRWGGPEDEPALQRIRPREQSYLRHFDEGCMLLVGEVDGTPASFNWFECGGVHESRSNGYTFHLGAGACWAFGFEVDPKFRMSGIFHKHWHEAVRMLTERGRGRVYGSIQNDNPRSVNSHRRLGFELLYHYRVLRVLGIEHHRATPFEDSGQVESSGLGLWEGRDVSAD